MNNASNCRSSRKLSSSSWSRVTSARIVGSPPRGDSACVPELGSESWEGASAGLDSVESSPLPSDVRRRGGGWGRIGMSE